MGRFSKRSKAAKNRYCAKLGQYVKRSETVEISDEFVEIESDNESEACEISVEHAETNEDSKNDEELVKFMQAVRPNYFEMNNFEQLAAPIFLVWNADAPSNLGKHTRDGCATSVRSKQRQRKKIVDCKLAASMHSQPLEGFNFTRSAVPASRSTVSLTPELMNAWVESSVVVTDEETNTTRNLEVGTRH